jgi:MFS family permease
VTVALGPAYQRLWLSTSLSNVGDGIRLAAFPLVAASLTGRPVLIAGVAVAAQLPWLLVGVVAGAVVDRADRRRLMAAIDATRATTLAVLLVAMLTGHLGLGTLYLVAFVGGVGETLRDTAAGTLVPALLPPDRWERANGLLVSAEVIGNELLGPALGGWLFAVSASLPFGVNAGALAVAALLILSLPPVFLPAREVPARLRTEVLEGMRYLIGNPLLRRATMLVVLLAGLDAGWFAILVLYADRVLGVTATVFGVLLGVGALGGVLGGFLAGRVVPALTTRRALAGAIALTGLAQLVLGLTSSLVVAGGCLALSGFAFATGNVAMVSLRQRQTPAALLGRVTASYRTLAMAASAAGALLGGAAAGAYGLRIPMLVGAPALLLAGALALPLLRADPQEVYSAES